MSKRLLPAVLCLLACCLFVPAWAQPASDIEMADALRANGKIYVVVTVLSVIFIGLAIYLVRLDRRIARIEKERGASAH